jgi:hypothetical protein
VLLLPLTTTPLVIWVVPLQKMMVLVAQWVAPLLQMMAPVVQWVVLLLTMMLLHHIYTLGQPKPEAYRRVLLFKAIIKPHQPFQLT